VQGKGLPLEAIEAQLNGARPLSAAYYEGPGEALLIVVVEGAKRRLRILRQEEPRLSVISVSAEAFGRDVESGDLGELVAGPLLLPYVPVLNAPFLQEQERRYLRRVVLELLADLLASYGPLARDFLLKEEYFYYKKLRVLLELHPLLPSLSFACPATRHSLHKLSRVLDSLIGEGLLVKQAHCYRLSSLSTESRLKSLLRGIRRTLARYVAYGSFGLGATGLLKNIWQDRPSSLEGLPELELPERLLEMEECALVFEENWREASLERLGHRGAALEIRRPNLLSSRELWLVHKEGRPLKLTAKIYGGIYAAKWTFIGTWTLLSRRFSLSPLARLYKEYMALRELSKLGVPTAKLLALAPRVPALVTSYIEGRNLDEELQGYFSGKADLAHIEEAGRLLSRVHSLGWCLGDTKPDNMLVGKDGRLYLVDLEQAERGGDMSWDLALFLYFASRFNPSAARVEEMAKRFIGAYLERGDREAVKGAMQVKYLNVFLPILLPQTALAVKRALREALGDSPRGTPR
jgi:tRNA A-37 threonylcarbamoyl transferase component Bud32